MAAWLAPSIAERIERAGMPTMFVLIDRINGIGARWWTGVPGIGAGKAARIVQWLQSHEGLIGVRIGAHVAAQRTALQPADLAAVGAGGYSLGATGEVLGATRAERPRRPLPRTARTVPAR